MITTCSKLCRLHPRAVSTSSGRKTIKIYTKTGDRGKTSLFSGERVFKSLDRVEAYGDVDELNSVLGALLASLPGDASPVPEQIRHIQSALLHLGACLARTSDSPKPARLEIENAGLVGYLEKAIDAMEEALPPLTGFVLPGGHPSAAWAHLARTVCRRAERHVVRLAGGPGKKNAGPGLEPVVACLNRLSDYLFVLARHLNRITGVQEHLWKE